MKLVLWLGMGLHMRLGEGAGSGNETGDGAVGTLADWAMYKLAIWVYKNFIPRICFRV